MDAARNAEALGYDSVWAADRIIIPWQIKTDYPYSADRRFIVPPDKPFLEPLTCLAFLAGCTRKIMLGMSVLVLPYRHPLYWAKVVTTIDRLSMGRLILGVGVGWMGEEFDALGVPFKERGAISDEQLQLVKELWEKEHSEFQGNIYRFTQVAFYPKPFQRPRIPVWVGGEGFRARRRAAYYGDAWFPYYVRITPQELAANFDNVRQIAAEAGRDADRICLSCCLPVDLRRDPVPQTEGRLMGSPGQVAETLMAYRAVGVEHIALQFMVPHWPERQEQIECFAREVLPAFKS